MKMKKQQHNLSVAVIMEQKTESTGIEKVSSAVTLSELSDDTDQCKQNSNNGIENTDIGSDVTTSIHNSSTLPLKNQEYIHSQKQ